MKLLIVIFLALFGNALIAQSLSIEQIDEATNATTPELIASANYSVETHYVTTEDGYILAIHRIPKSPVSPVTKKNKPVVFLMHGILLDSSCWVIIGPGNALAYLLADSGYDVWMGNARGNTYSKNHTSMADLTSKEFWDFSWHEIGYYDLPAMIDYVLNSTGQNQLRYIGFSQGTTTFYVMTSLKPTYNNKIKVMFALAPVAYFANVKSPLLQELASILNSLTLIAELFGINEFDPGSEMITTIKKNYCSNDSITQNLCSNLLFVVFGFDQNQLNKTELPIYLGHFPASCSIRQLIHYGQEMNSKRFAWYDYGQTQNQKLYNSTSPPSYNLTAVTAPVYLIYGQNDWVAAPKDVEKLYSQLSNAIELFNVTDNQWNHIDFIWAIDAKEYVYDHLMTELKNYVKL